MYSDLSPVHIPAPSVLVIEEDDLPCDRAGIQTILGIADCYDATYLDRGVEYFCVTFESLSPATDRRENIRCLTAIELIQELERRTNQIFDDEAVLAEC